MCTLDTGDIWCGVVTVGEVKSSGGVLVANGFTDVGGVSAGDLDGYPADTMFSVGANDYTINGLYVGVPGDANAGSLFLLLDKDLTDDDKRDLVLTIDGITTEYAFSDATRLSTGLYDLPRTGLDWSLAAKVTVRLQGPTTPDDPVDPPPVDLPADITTTGEVVVNGPGARGGISDRRDIDWFAVELEADRTYRVNLKGGILIAPARTTTPNSPWLSRRSSRCTTRAAGFFTTRRPATTKA